MDPDFEDRPELTGSLISLEFGPGGRVTQLWASDPMLPDEGEEFQFILPPIQFSEETSDDFLPGTVLIGARTSPDDHWIVDRNRIAINLNDFESETFDPNVVHYQYQFPQLEDIYATGKFYELPGQIPQVCWDVLVKNQGKISIEIGELGFPLAFNNYYEGFGWTDDQLKLLWQKRVTVHKFIGGAASWLFAQRMTAEPPSLLVFPGEGTGWEFFHHVPSTLNTPLEWEGIPIVYAHSRATIEREEWQEWFNDHTSLILEPGDSRTFQMRFVPTESDKVDGVHATLGMCGHPTIKVLPSAVAPLEVGIGLEISGASPKKFYVSREAQVETDIDEDSAFCFIKPTTPGPIVVSFHDKHDCVCYAHLMFTDSIRNLIQKRAEYIATNQVVEDKSSPLDHAIVLTNISSGQKVVETTEYLESSGLECALADTLFLAEKNTIYPDREQIKIVDRVIQHFLLDDVQNPGNHAVASVLGNLGSYFGRPLSYPHVYNLYHSMYRVAKTYGETAWPAKDYLLHSYCTAMAMFEHGWLQYVRTVGILGYSQIYSLLADLRSEGLEAEAEKLDHHVRFKAKELMKQKYPYAGETVMDTSGFEEVFAAARYMADDEHLERTVRCAFAARSLAPSWFWYGSDKRHWVGADSTPIKALVDRGEACLAHTTIPNSLIFFGLMDRDYLGLPDAYMRMAFGGMVGPWALVRRDGAASMCYCPDLASKQAGYNVYTGASGLGYHHYLANVGSYVLPNREQGIYSFGCHFAYGEGTITVRPWDGVGRRIILRQVGAEFELGFGCIEELRLDERKRWFEMDIANPSDKTIRASLTMKGLWGLAVEVDGKRTAAANGVIRVEVDLPAGRTMTVKGKVVT